jgi:hypothetical protein
LEVIRLRALVWPLASLLTVVAAATCVMLGIREFLVEPEPVALACAASPEGWRCIVRDWAVKGFLQNTYGTVAVIAGIAATLLRWRWIALIAVLAGVAGAVLYTFELSGVGLLLGALVWVHRGAIPPAAHDRRPGQQQA